MKTHTSCATTFFPQSTHMHIFKHTYMLNSPFGTSSFYVPQSDLFAGDDDRANRAAGSNIYFDCLHFCLPYRKSTFCLI